MNDRIIVYDNFLSDEDLKNIFFLIEKNENYWDLNHKSSNKIKNLNQFGYLEVTNKKYFGEYLFDKIKTYLNIKSCDIQRIYFNGQLPHIHGHFHEDGCDNTVLIYVSEYNEEWGGFTQIKTPNEGYKFINPTQKRMLFFPGNWKHKGFAYSYDFCPMRLSLAYKLNNVKL